MERQALLGLLEDSNDPEQRDNCRAGAKLLKHILGPGRDYIINLDEAVRHPEPPGDPDYMEFDSEGDRPPGEPEA